MPRIHRVKKARKEHKCSKCGRVIGVGEPYYWYKTRHGFPRYAPSRPTKRCIDHYPKPSEMQQNPKRAALLEIAERLDVTEFCASSDAEAFCQEAAEDIRNVAGEYRESAQNIEEGFGHPTSASEEAEERARELEEVADELEGMYFDDPEEDEDEDEDEAFEEWEGSVRDDIAAKLSEIA